jgi:hypothetical protein
VGLCDHSRWLSIGSGTNWVTLVIWNGFVHETTDVPLWFRATVITWLPKGLGSNWFIKGYYTNPHPFLCGFMSSYQVIIDSLRHKLIWNGLVHETTDIPLWFHASIINGLPKRSGSNWFLKEYYITHSIMSVGLWDCYSWIIYRITTNWFKKMYYTKPRTYRWGFMHALLMGYPKDQDQID